MKTPQRSISTALEQRCDIRLANDAADLAAAESERMQIEIKRFAERVTEIRVRFPQVKTAFKEVTSGRVEIRQSEVLAKICPNAGNGFPYPLGSPEVKLYFPALDGQVWAPWLGGLLWLHESTPGDDSGETVPGFLQQMMAVLKLTGEPGAGIPCLWREGEWDTTCDLVFVVRQIHRLLTDPGDYAPGDSLNPQAALYWAAHQDQLPLEPPIPQLYESGGGEVPEGPEIQAARFTLKEVK